MINRDPMEKPFISAKDLDDNHPDCFYDAFDLSNAVMIRSYASQNLMKKNVT